MEQIVTTIIGGVIVALIVSWFGIGGTKHIRVHSPTVRRSGKWIIFISVLVIIAGLAWAGSGSPVGGGLDFNNTETLYGLTLAGYGLLAFFVGRIVAWFQRN